MGNKMYNLLSIDKRIYLFDDYLHENIEHFYCSIKFPPIFFHSILSSLVPTNTDLLSTTLN